MADGSLLVSHPHGPNYAPPLLPISSAETRLFLKGFLGRQSSRPFLPQTVVRMERIHPAPAQTLLQGKARIFPKISVEEISRAIRQFAPNYCGDCVNDKPQDFDNIRRFVSITVVRVGPSLAHGCPPPDPT